MGLRRIGNMQWVSKATANKYELILADEGDEKIVKGVDVIEKDHRIHLVDPTETVSEIEEPDDGGCATGVTVHHKTAAAIHRQLEIANDFFYLMDRWNQEIEMKSAFGREIKTLVPGEYISWENFIFLPDPLASGDYIFGAIRQGKAAALHSWLDLPEGDFIVPTDGSPDSVQESLACGQRFHAWEFASFDTPAAAGQFTIKALNASKTTYATAIKKLLGKENASITRNDFYRNKQNQMCRVEVIRNESGLVVRDVPVVPTLADCLDCLLAPYVKANAFASIEKRG